MSARHIFGACLAALALAAASPGSAQITGPTRIEPRPSLNETVGVEYVADVRLGEQAGRMQVRYNPQRAGPVTGTLLGDRVTGFYYTDPPAPRSGEPPSQPVRSLALLRYRGAAPIQVITADYDWQLRQWMGMAHWLISEAGAGSSAANAVGFRTLAPASRFRYCPRGQSCPPPDTSPPAVATANPAIAIDPAALAGLGVSVGTERGPLVVRAAAGASQEGIVSGHVFGEAITGHYARTPGTVAFLRLRNGRPIQVWRGVLDSGGSSGRGFPLDVAGGSPFNWSATNDQIVTGVRSLFSRNRCLHVEDPASGPGGAVTTFTCGPSSRSAWVLFVIGPAGSASDSAHFSLVSTQTGLCMDLPLTTGQTARQQPCRGGLSQDLGINTRILDVNGNVVAVEHSPNTAHYAASTMFHIYGNPVGGVSAECLGLRGSTGEAITMSCSDSKGDWTPHL